MSAFLFIFLTLRVASANVPEFLIDYCLDCHEDPKPKGDLSLENLGLPAKDFRIWDKVYEQVLLGQMPPENKDQPSEEEREKVLAWIKAELTKAGHPPEDKLARPGYGNYVSHEKLFGKHPAKPSYSQPRLWRIRPAVYENQMRTFDSRAKFVRPFSLSSSHGFYDYDQGLLGGEENHGHQ